MFFLCLLSLSPSLARPRSFSLSLFFPPRLCLFVAGLRLRLHVLQGLDAWHGEDALLGSECIGATVTIMDSGATFGIDIGFHMSIVNTRVSGTKRRTAVRYRNAI